MQRTILRNIAIVIVMAFCLTGCAVVNTEDPLNSDISSDLETSSDTVAEGSLNNNAEVLIEKPSNINTREYGEFFYLTEKSDDNVISVKVPVLDTENEEEVNAVIYEYISERLTEILSYKGGNLKVTESGISDNNADYENYFIELDYRISTRTDTFVSIIFEGFMNYKEAAHPNDLFITLNIDIESGSKVKYSDVYLVNDEFYKTFIEHANRKFTNISAMISAEDVFDKKIFLDGLLNDGKSVCVYYTSLAVGFSYEVGHALGDHIEIEIPYSVLEPYKK